MAKLLIMDRSGHSEEVFDKADKVSVAEAERRFAQLTGAGFTAAVRTAPGQSKQVRKFDPDAQETLFVPPLVGG